MEPLQEMPSTSWQDIRDVFKQNWPEHLIAYKLLETQLIHPGLKDYFSMKIYCPYGDISNGAISVSNKIEGRQIMIFPLKGITIIEECLSKTKFIDWTRSFMVEAASEEILECLKRLRVEKYVQLKYERADAHVFSREQDAFRKLSCPPETYVSNLKAEHLDIVDKTWTYTGRHTRKLFEALMNNGLIHVLYSTSNEILAWISISCNGSLTHLYCLEPHRRKGYAEFITKYAINDLIKSKSDVLAYTVPDNLKSKSLFKKLGFQDIGHVYWIMSRPELKNH